MDKPLTEKQIRDIIKNEIKQSQDFKQWRKFSNVTDIYSPITGASQQIGFFGKTKIGQPTVTGSKGGNAALTSLLTALSNLGLLIDSSS